MFKLFFVIAVVGFACAIPVTDDNEDDATDSAAESVEKPGASDGDLQTPHLKMPEFPENPNSDPETIAKMKPAPGETINAVSTFLNSHTEWKDGKPVTKSEGSYTINKNGVVESGTFPDKQTSE